MDDREIVAAIVAGDLAALADAYDRYAEFLYGYCYWMLNEAADAADALQDTFVVAAAKLGGLRDPACCVPGFTPWPETNVTAADTRQRWALVTRPTGSAMPATIPTGPNCASGSVPHCRGWLRVSARSSSLASGMTCMAPISRRCSASPGIRRTPWAPAPVPAREGPGRTAPRPYRARSLPGARHAARRLGRMADRGHVEAISQHADQCEACRNRRRGTLGKAALSGMAPLAVLPPWLREDVLGLCSDSSQPTLSYRREVGLRAGPFGRTASRRRSGRPGNGPWHSPGSPRRWAS